MDFQGENWSKYAYSPSKSWGFLGRVKVKDFLEEYTDPWLSWLTSDRICWFVDVVRVPVWEPGSLRCSLPPWLVSPGQSGGETQSALANCQSTVQTWQDGPGMVVWWCGGVVVRSWERSENLSDFISYPVNGTFLSCHDSLMSYKAKSKKLKAINKNLKKFDWHWSL